MSTRVAGIALGVCLMAAAAHAQVPPGGVLKPTDSLNVTFPAATVAADGLNAPDGYRVRATSAVTGLSLREWDTAASARSLVLPGTLLPEGAFTVTVHPFNSRGVAGASNVNGPFGLATTPSPLTGVSVGVVAGVP